METLEVKSEIRLIVQNYFHPQYQEDNWRTVVSGQSIEEVTEKFWKEEYNEIGNQNERLNINGHAYTEVKYVEYLGSKTTLHVSKIVIHDKDDPFYKSEFKEAAYAERKELEKKEEEKEANEDVNREKSEYIRLKDKYEYTCAHGNCDKPRDGELTLYCSFHEQQING